MASKLRGMLLGMEDDRPQVGQRAGHADLVEAVHKYDRVRGGLAERLPSHETGVSKPQEVPCGRWAGQSGLMEVRIKGCWSSNRQEVYK